MRARLPVVLAALVLAALPLGLHPTVAWAAPTCFGKPATHVMHEGDGIYGGTAGPDVVIGSKGPDVILLQVLGGADLVCAGDGDDAIIVAGPNSKADGGAGRDGVSAFGGGLARGGSGDDTLQAIGAGGRAEGGSGSDTVQADADATADGGSGNDTVRGAFAHALLGGSGSDDVTNNGGAPAIDCGSGYDRVAAHGDPNVRRCEGTLP